MTSALMSRAGSTGQREKAEEREVGGLLRGAGLVLGRYWAGSGGWLFFLSKAFSFFFSLVLKLKNKPVQNFLEKFVKILFRELIKYRIL